MHKELNHDALIDLLSQLPPSASSEQVVNLIVNTIAAYNMGDNWFEIAIRIGHILEQLDDYRDATIH